MSTPRRARTPTVASLSKNQYNKVVYMLSMGYNTKTALQHKNINVSRLIRIYESIIIGRNRTRALEDALRTSSPNHRRRGESPSMLFAHAISQVRQRLNRNVMPRNRKKGGSVIST